MHRRVFLSLLAATTAGAHDLYLMPEVFRAAKPGKRVVWFHLGDAFPESEVAVRPERLLDAKAVGTRGSATVADFRTVGNRVSGIVDLNATGSWVMSVQTMPNQIEIEASKFEDYLRHEGLSHVIDARARSGDSRKPGLERYTKFVKSLMVVGAPDAFCCKPVGLPIEIVPEVDPYTLKPGTQLPIQVLFEGKPAANLRIQAGWANGAAHSIAVAGTTDQNGKLRIPLGSGGICRLHTVLMRPRASGDEDWESFWASMTFEVR